MPNLERLPRRALPQAAGAAALLRIWLRLCHGGHDPGQVYALMILAGRASLASSVVLGADPLGSPAEDHLFWGNVELGGGERVELPIAVEPGSLGPLDAALWWPEDANQLHSTVFLHLLDPRGKLVASSTSGPAVFQRTRALTALEPGIWTVRIDRADAGALPQTVYWAAVLS
jgi:hypothetical protein